MSRPAGRARPRERPCPRLRALLFVPLLAALALWSGAPAGLRAEEEPAIRQPVPRTPGRTRAASSANVAETMPRGDAMPAPARGGAAAWHDLPLSHAAPAVLSHQARCRQTLHNGAASRGAEEVASASVQLLEKQYCLMQAQAIREAREVRIGLPALSERDIARRCDDLTRALMPQIETLAGQAPDSVIADLAASLHGSARPFDQVHAIGRSCLGLGYERGDSRMALAAALIMVGAGQAGYGEVPSHHLRMGLGTPAGAAAAAAWMNMALAALERGNPPVLGQETRIAALRAATNEWPGAAPGRQRAPPDPGRR
ncbi:hypothetical protein [Pontibaca methylaminivorans]|uniref:Uncharacterized protein n=1 Tax=Pontibaca methylaminivorans TaxID=515897 RepID=A0A1R3X2G1_9RHOB|nr:hypothetical protein [Pontibaca methylaminivorans]SIT85108.1 hypothetical protein SAMN05421849_2251 [Pontibaca methylaminivorans]